VRHLWLGKESRSVVSPFGLHSGLRQSGSAFGAGFIGTRSTSLRAGSEGVPFRFGDKRLNDAGCDYSGDG
jgi:hypothetical protein